MRMGHSGLRIHESLNETGTQGLIQMNEDGHSGFRIHESLNETGTQGLIQMNENGTQWALYT